MLYYADKHKTDQYILELAVCLPRLVRQVRKCGDIGLDVYPVLYPEMRGPPSTSEEVAVAKKRPLGKLKKLRTATSRSTESSPRRGRGMEYPKSSILDEVDGLDTTF